MYPILWRLAIFFGYFPPQAPVAQVTMHAQIVILSITCRESKGVRNKLSTKVRLLLGTLNHGHAGHTGPALRAPFDSVSTCDCIQVKRMGEEGGEEAKAVC